MKRTLVLGVVVGALSFCTTAAAGENQEGRTDGAIVCGTGLSQNEDPGAAGTEAAEQALAALNGEKAKLVLVFDNVAYHDWRTPTPERAAELDARRSRMLERVSSVFDEAIMFGGSCYDPITSKGNQGAVGVLALAGGVKIATAVSDNKGGCKACGLRLGEELKKVKVPEGKGRLLILFGKCHVPGNDQVAWGVKKVLGENFPLIGGAASRPQTIYYQGKVVQDSNLGILLWGDFSCGFSLKGGKDKKSLSREGITSSAREAVKEALGEKKEKAALIFAVDCGGRRSMIQKDLPLELEAMKQEAGGVPIFGFYGSGETGHPSNTEPAKGVGWHVAICVLFER